MWTPEEVKLAEKYKQQALECWKLARHITANADFSNYIELAVFIRIPSTILLIPSSNITKKPRPLAQRLTATCKPPPNPPKRPTPPSSTRNPLATLPFATKSTQPKPPTKPQERKPTNKPRKNTKTRKTTTGTRITRQALPPKQPT